MDKLNLSKENKVIGYTTGVFDMFHIGHLNIIKHAKNNCDFLIVGVTTDNLVGYKNTKAIIPFEERFQIIQAIEYVDLAVPQDNMDKFAAWEKYRFNKMFVGSDWKGTEKWNLLEDNFKKVGTEIQYFPYTEGTSSSKLKTALATLINLGAENGFDEP